MIVLYWPVLPLLHAVGSWRWCCWPGDSKSREAKDGWAECGGEAGGVEPSKSSDAKDGWVEPGQLVLESRDPN